MVSNVESQIDLSSNEKRICRVCLSTNKDSQYIFQIESHEENIDTTNLCNKLLVCGGIEVVEHDGLPTTICNICITKINAAYELRQQCQKTDIELRRLFGKPLKNDKISQSIVDKCCQTDESLIMELLNCSSHIVNNLSGTENNSKRNMSDNNKSNISFKKYNNNVASENSKNMSKKYSEKNNQISKRKPCKTKQMTMFKKVTSIENLKNNKEKQRQFMKKNTLRLNLKKMSSKNEKKIGNNLWNSADSVDVSYKCLECNRCYTTKKSLQRHLSIHADRKFKCESCNKKFIHIDKLFEHKKQYHEEEHQPIQCKLCSKTFRKHDTMLKHLNMHKNTDLLDINFQQSKIDTENIQYSDLKNNKRELIINIGNSDSSVTNQENEKSCQSNEPNINFNIDNDSELFVNTSFHSCKYCNKHYTTEKSLQRHLLIHGEKKFTCDICNMKFYRQDRLKSHCDKYGHKDTESSEHEKAKNDGSTIKLINTWIRTEFDSDKESKDFSCKICSKSFDNKKSLSKHQINAHEIKSDNCTVCKQSCICPNKNKDQGNNSEKAKSFTCNECNKSFEKESKLQKHIRIHERAKEQQDSNFKRFLCHICSKTFKQNTGLMFHMRTHTGYKPHVCKYCGRGFTSNSNCINHERTHTGDRPFVCHFCSAAFAKSCTLKAHITTHTGEANYHCKTCGKSFRRLKYLKEHRFTHTGEKPYACKICGTAYSHSGSLFVHEKKCKAQYSNYQPVVGQNVSNYNPDEITIPVSTSVTTTIPSSHFTNINNVLNSQNDKIYIDDIQRMNTSTVARLPCISVHQNSDLADATRNINLVGQMFNS